MPRHAPPWITLDRSVLRASACSAAGNVSLHDARRWFVHHPGHRPYRETRFKSRNRAADYRKSPWIAIIVNQASVYGVLSVVVCHRGRVPSERTLLRSITNDQIQRKSRIGLKFGSWKISKTIDENFSWKLEYNSFQRNNNWLFNKFLFGCRKNSKG